MPNSDLEETLYDVAQVAGLLGLSPQRVRDLARTGKVPAEITTANGMHARYRFKVSEIDMFLLNSGLSRDWKTGERQTATSRLAAMRSRERLQPHDDLKDQLAHERHGRHLAEARIDEVNRAPARQRRAIIHLTVGGFALTEEDLPQPM